MMEGGFSPEIIPRDNDKEKSVLLWQSSVEEYVASGRGAAFVREAVPIAVDCVLCGTLPLLGLQPAESALKQPVLTRNSRMWDCKQAGKCNESESAVRENVHVRTEQDSEAPFVTCCQSPAGRIKLKERTASGGRALRVGAAATTTSRVLLGAARDESRLTKT